MAACGKHHRSTGQTSRDIGRLFDRWMSPERQQDAHRSLPMPHIMSTDRCRCLTQNLSHNPPPQILPLESVVITHPIHPMVGQSLPVVRHVRALGRSAVSVRFPDGHTATIPVDWTDLRPAAPPLQLQGRRPLLHPAALQQLRLRVDELMHKASSAAKLDDGPQSFPASEPHETAHADDALPRVATPAPTPVPRRRRQPPAQGRGSAPKHRGGA